MSVNTVTPNGLIRELAIRQYANETVALYWNSETDEISLHVKNGENDFIVNDVPKDSALDAWHHPYAYADWVLKTGKSRLENVAA